MNTANWIPDLFMKRVMENGEWTLFSPSDVPDLHDKFGKAFERPTPPTKKRLREERSRHFKKHPGDIALAQDAHHAFETGHPWITFKDPCNIRSPQQHVGWCTAPTSAPRSPSTPTMPKSPYATSGR
jgi:ribonucleoside-diphosphate reductase alpha chain